MFVFLGLVDNLQILWIELRVVSLGPWLREWVWANGGLVSCYEIEESVQKVQVLDIVGDIDPYNFHICCQILPMYQLPDKCS